MEIIYNKCQPSLGDNGFFQIFYGYESAEKLSEIPDFSSFSKQHYIKKKLLNFPDYNYPILKYDYRNCRNLPNVSFISHDTKIIQKNINIENEALFLEFLDLNLNSKLDIINFIKKYGFLTNQHDFKKQKVTFKKLESSFTQDPRNLVKVKNSKNIYHEPFSIWILLQSRLRTLVSLWRYLITSETLPYYNKNIYEKENFKISENKVIFKNIISESYRISNLPYENFDEFKNKKIKDFVNFKLNPEIDLTDDYNRHDVSKIGLGIFHTSPNFLVHFSNEFLSSQLNQLQNFFGSNLEVGKKVGLDSSLETFPFNFTQFMNCDSLFGAILNQFVMAMVEKKSFIRCYECGKWTQKISVRKERKLYCSDGCRAQANRSRKVLKLNIEAGDFKKYKTLEGWLKSLHKNHIKKDYTDKILNKDGSKHLILPSLFNNIIANCLRDCSTENLARHLGVDTSFLGDINFIKKEKKYKELTLNPYRDWDFYK